MSAVCKATTTISLWWRFRPYATIPGTSAKGLACVENWYLMEASCCRFESCRTRIGSSFKGRTAVSKTANQGSSP